MSANNGVLLAQRQADLEHTLEELEADRQAMHELTTIEVVYRLADAAYLAGWYREWADFQLEDKKRYVAAMALVEDLLKLVDERLK